MSTPYQPGEADCSSEHSGSMIKYGKRHKLFNVSSSIIVVEIFRLGDAKSITHGFNIEKLKRGEYTIPKYLLEWLKFEIIQARLAK